MKNEMQYLEIKPDYIESGIKSEFNGYIEIGDLPFDNNIKNRIKSLNDQYKNIIPMGEKMKKSHMDLIYQLDKAGFSLKTDIERKYNFKVKYFSEGLLKYLFEPPLEDDYRIKKGFYSKILRVIEKILGNKTKNYT